MPGGDGVRGGMSRLELTAILLSIVLTEFYSFKMGFETFAPLPIHIVLGAGVKLHPHVPSSGENIGRSVDIISTMKSELFTL